MRFLFSPQNICLAENHATVDVTTTRALRMRRGSQRRKGQWSRRLKRGRKKALGLGLGLELGLELVV